MAKQAVTPEDLAALQVETNAKIAAALEQLVENAPPKVLTYGDEEYQAQLRAEGYFDEFPVTVYQNGKVSPGRGVKPENRDRVANLSPGTWLGGKVEVRYDTRGRLHLGYQHARIEDRMRFQSTVARTFDELIEKLWAEMHPAAQAAH